MDQVKLSLALDTSINFLKPVMAGNVLIAETKELQWAINMAVSCYYHQPKGIYNCHI